MVALVTCHVSLGLIPKPFVEVAALIGKRVVELLASNVAHLIGHLAELEPRAIVLELGLALGDGLILGDSLLEGEALADGLSDSDAEDDGLTLALGERLGDALLPASLNAAAIITC